MCDDRGQEISATAVGFCRMSGMEDMQIDIRLTRNPSTKQDGCGNRASGSRKSIHIFCLSTCVDPCSLASSATDRDGVAGSVIVVLSRSKKPALSSNVLTER